MPNDWVEDQRIVAISDNLSTRATQEVQDWLKAHPRCGPTPARSSKHKGTD
jgi:hypothetical protein